MCRRACQCHPSDFRRASFYAIFGYNLAMNSYNYKTTEFTQKMLIAVGILLAAISVVLFVYYAIDVVLLFFGAVLLAIFLRGLADLIRRNSRMSEGMAVLIASFLLLVVLAA